MYQALYLRTMSGIPGTARIISVLGKAGDSAAATSIVHFDEAMKGTGRAPSRTRRDRTIRGAVTLPETIPLYESCGLWKERFV